MTYTNQNTTMFSGDHMDIHVQVYFGNARRIYKDLTDVREITYHVRQNQDLSHDALIEKTLSNNDIDILYPTQGTFRISLKPEDTQNMRGTYFHLCRIMDAYDRESIVLVGNLNIREGINI